MKEEQIKKLKQLMAGYQNCQGERRERLTSVILAYLDGCLAGID